ncbi:daunorubicin C-13 ketoreductase, partial [Fulvivirga lutimaris]|uniref:daunorubicin C-13 ketoreductase n=1 Tax=Fulvivirga lutimaris TaxID=1819566 RepID=UPI00162912A9
DQRGKEALEAISKAHSVLTADLSNLEETKLLAEKVNQLGSFDAIIHNAGVYHASGDLIVKVNTLAPYILTCLIKPPKRLVYMSSSMHTGGQPRLGQLASDFSKISYSDSKLHDLILAKAVARLWPDVYSNAVDPGWVPTKMGGARAPDSLQKGHETQAWLAVSDDLEATVSGHYFYHQKTQAYQNVADDINVQEEFLKTCEQLTRVTFPKE